MWSFSSPCILKLKGNLDGVPESAFRIIMFSKYLNEWVKEWTRELEKILRGHGPSFQAGPHLTIDNFFQIFAVE